MLRGISDLINVEAAIKWSMQSNQSNVAMLLVYNPYYKCIWKSVNSNTFPYTQQLHLKLITFVCWRSIEYVVWLLFDPTQKNMYCVSTIQHN